MSYKINYERKYLSLIMFIISLAEDVWGFTRGYIFLSFEGILVVIHGDCSFILIINGIEVDFFFQNC